FPRFLGVAAVGLVARATPAISAVGRRVTGARFARMTLRGGGHDGWGGARRGPAAAAPGRGGRCGEGRAPGGGKVSLLVLRGARRVAAVDVARLDCRRVLTVGAVGARLGSGPSGPGCGAAGRRAWPAALVWKTK